MQQLEYFLKGSTIIDYGFLIAIISAGIILAMAGIVMLLVAKTRKFFFLFLFIAFLPFILGLGGTAVRYYSNERALAQNDIDPGSEYAYELRQGMLPDYVITVLIGAASSSLPVLLGLAGLIFKRGRRPEPLLQQPGMRG